MNHHDPSPATANTADAAICAPSYLRAYLPIYDTTKDLAYKSSKVAWLRDHPAATSQQVEAAFQALARELGL